MQTSYTSKKTIKDMPEIPIELYIPNRKLAYTRLEEIGRGGFGKCFKARNNANGTLACVKVLWKGMIMSPKDKGRIQSEVNILKAMKHENIVKYRGSYETNEFIFIFMDFCENHSLEEYIQHHGVMSEKDVKTILLQLINVAEYMKNERVVHRDLKLSNIFLTEGLSIRVGDFGLSKKLEGDQTKRNTFCGTFPYLAPEILCRQEYSHEVDIWAIGVITYKLLIGSLPFKSKNLKNLNDQIKEAHVMLPIESTISNNAKDIIKIILKADPAKRPSFEQIRQHPFLRKDDPNSPQCKKGAQKPQLSSAILISKKRLQSQTEVEEGNQYKRLKKFPPKSEPKNPEKRENIINGETPKKKISQTQDSSLKTNGATPQNKISRTEDQRIKTCLINKSNTIKAAKKRTCQITPLKKPQSVTNRRTPVISHNHGPYYVPSSNNKTRAQNGLKRTVCQDIEKSYKVLDKNIHKALNKFKDVSATMNANDGRLEHLLDCVKMFQTTLEDAKKYLKLL